MEIKDYIEQITKGFLRLCFGMFLVWMGFSIHNLTKETPTVEPVEYIIKRDYNENEKKVVDYMDSVMQLPPNEQRELVKELADRFDRLN